MISYKAKKTEFEIIRSADTCNTPFPFIRYGEGIDTIYCISPLHGRSFIVGRNKDGHFIISKGNGLSYSMHTFIYTQESQPQTWGLLLEKDAIRDFDIGREVEALGIKTNKMEYVIKLNQDFIYPTNGSLVNPVLLQYSVECPYRICDFAFIAAEQIQYEVQKWAVYNEYGYTKKHMVAADVLIRNLRIMHDNNILHNAIHIQNYTWALELLDFELGRTNNHPHDQTGYEQYLTEFFNRELIDTYEVINYIAWCFKEIVEFKEIDNLFAKYDFNLDKFKLYSSE